LNKVRTPIEVRYAETDQMGVVYHANYLTWFEIGRTKFVENIGLNYEEMEAQGILAPVTNAEISYKKPIRYGEDAYVETWLARYNGLRTVYAYEILDGEDNVAVSGTTEHVIVKKDSFRPLSLRRKFPDWHETYSKQIDGDS